MAKENINTLTVGICDAKIEYIIIESLNGAKRTYAVENSLVRFTIGDDIFEKSWREPGIREYADRMGSLNFGSLSEWNLPRLSSGNK